MTRVLFIALITILIAASGPSVPAQNRMNYSVVSADSGHVALGLAIRKLNVSGTLMQAPAHPDDETNALFALFTHGIGLRSVDVQNNRGEGGQNEIGPELFRDIGVLRTAELLSAHRIDGAEQYFTRAIDYGYSFDPEEVINKWGRDAIIGDYVRLIRTLRPDVLVTMNIQGRGGDRAHEATTILAREAYRAAGDPNRYPEQIAEGLRAWQPKKLYFSAGFGVIGAGRAGRAGGAGGAGGAGTAGGAGRAAPRVTRINTAVYDELLGRSYAEIGSDARSNHKCQGTSGLPALPGFGGGRGPGGGGGQLQYQLVDSSIPGQLQKDESGLFDGIDVTLAGIAQFAGQTPPDALTTGLAAIVEQAQKATSAFAAGDDAATAAPIEAGLAAIRTLRSQLASLRLGDSARYEIDFRLRNKERDYQNAVVAAHGLTFDAVADDGLVVGGQSVRLSMLAVNRGTTDVDVTSVEIAGFDPAAGAGSADSACAANSVKKDAVFTCSAEMRVPTNAKPTTPYFTDVYWKNPSSPAINIFEPGVPFGVPFAPTPFRATFHVKAGAAEVTREVPITFRYVKDIYNGDKRMEVNVVPAFSVRMTPPLAVVPVATGASAAKPLEREIHVAVTNGTTGAADATVALDVPAGWRATPPTAAISFLHEDESLSARFIVTAPTQVKTGEYPLRAIVTSPSAATARFTTGYQAIEYPHIQRRQVIKPAETTLKVVAVTIAPNLTVGYVNGVGDQVPPAIDQLGAKLEFIDQDDLAWGDLSKYDVIVTGVRAYERRSDLRAYNQRLLDYARRGGTVIVQYNKYEFNQSQYGPFAAQVSGNRVSDENAPVKVLVPSHPAFNYPNAIGAASWANWVQERGLYFLGDKDPRYVDLVSMTDSFQDNPGEKLGALVEARVGKGRWLYVGLGLWRQLPAGTTGAYELLANLLSLPKAPAGTAAP
ncbi:MAG TPA: NEW3 domain-containing protein [Vicinamibacterales bacterium]|nr:NEW3 domain-containing protein [Vicinamibacterales bacterium]